MTCLVIFTTHCLKTLDTTGNCQRPVFSLGVCQHNKKTCEKLMVIEVARELWKKNALVAQVTCFQMLDFETSKAISEVSKSNSNIFSEILRLSQKLSYFRGSRFSQC